MTTMMIVMLFKGKVLNPQPATEHCMLPHEIQFVKYPQKTMLLLLLIIMMPMIVQERQIQRHFTTNGIIMTIVLIVTTILFHQIPMMTGCISNY